MNKITLAQREALDVVKDMIDRANTSVPEFGTKILTLILGILNVDCRVEHTITQIDGDKITPIIPDNGTGGNDRLQINIPIDAHKHEDRMYAAEVSCTGDKNGIVCVTNTADVRYNGDFRDVQTSFNNK